MAAPDPNLDSRADKPKGTPWKPMLLVAAATAVLILLVPTEDERVVELPPAPAPATDTPAPAAQPQNLPATGGTPAGSLARRFIAAQRDSGKVDARAAYDEARRLAAEGRAEDAYLLDFYAARQGQADAAMSLARQADPQHWQAGGALTAPAPEQALKWYREAERAGHPDAKSSLTALKSWAEQAAKAGDTQAQRLMLAWQ